MGTTTLSRFFSLAVLLAIVIGGGYAASYTLPHIKGAWGIGGLAGIALYWGAIEFFEKWSK